MRTRGFRTFGLLVALVAIGTWSGLALALVPKENVSLLDQKEFFKPDLYISMSNVKLGEVDNSLAATQAWSRFYGEYGNDFHVFLDPRSGTPSSVIGHIPIIPGAGYGNHLTPADMESTLGLSATTIDSRIVGTAVRRFIDHNQDVLGINTTQLGPVRADKITEELWQVSIPQLVDGVPVRYGRVAATINNGNLVLLGTDTWGNVTINTHPSISEDNAIAAVAAYVGGQHPADKAWQKPTLEIIPYAPADLEGGAGYAGPVGQGYGHRLAWTIGFNREGDGGSWQASVDAQTGEMLEFKDVNEYITRKVTGGIYPLTDTGVCPDNARCGTMQPGAPMPWANTGFPNPDDFTNSAGLYNYTSGTLTTSLTGKFVQIVDTCGAINMTSATGDLNMGGANNDHDCVVPGGTSAGNTAASRSAFYEINKLKEQARGWLPLNAWLQAALQTNVNLNQTCNAFYSPSAGNVNFYRSGGGCRNTGEIAAVFDHEWGHGMDDNDTTGALSNSSETYADMTAALRLQQSCIGYGFWFTADQGCGMTADGTGFNGQNAEVSGQSQCELDCSGVRGADWDKQEGHTPTTPANFSCPKCSSGGGPCGREVHCDAIPDTQAGWDFAKRDLQAAPYNLDNTTAFMTANKVFYQGSGNIANWHTCTCPSTSNGCGATNAYLQWVAADDDDGNINNGTPHMTALFNAWNRHAIACTTPTVLDSGCAGGPTLAPTVTASPGSNQVLLSWSAVAGASKYWVLRSEGFAGCDFGKALIAEVVGTSYTDNQVANGTPYYYNVVAVGSSSACFSRASTCLTATPQPCAGAVSLDSSVYNCNDFVYLTLVDSDLIGAGSQSVTVRSTTEPTPESVTLTESPANSGIFVGFIQTTNAAPSNGDGMVSVSNGDSLTAKYTDVSYCGTPNVDVEQSSPIDCNGPIITNVHSNNVTGNSANVLWNTNEGSNSIVTYDSAFPPTANTASKATLDSAHSVGVTGLAPCTPYYYYVSSTDAAGNATTDTNGPSYYSFTTGVNVNPTYPYTGAPVPIPDNTPAGVSAIIHVSDVKPIVDVDVRIDNLTHTYDGDIEVHLIHPDGTDIMLSNRRGSSGDNYTNTVFDDSATTPIASGTAPFTGSFKPDGVLANLNGKLSNGDWKLYVWDRAAVDTGTITAWSLILTYPSQQCGPSIEGGAATYTDACNGSGSGGGNGVIEPGETITLPVRAHANGTSGVTGVSATLSTSTPGVTVTDNAATFGDMSADATSISNPNHFAFQVDPSVPCGSSLDFNLHFVSNEGNWNSSFSLPTGNPGVATNTYPSSDVPKPIPDVTTITSTTAIANTGTVSDVNVTVTLTHTYDGDLVIRLIGPNAVAVMLSNRHGGSGDNYTNTVFDDEATTPIASGVSPFTGSFKPDTPLSALDGIPANGTWTLEIQDAAAIDSGNLVSWSVTLTTTAAPTCNSCTPTLAGEATNLRWTSGSKDQLEWDAAPNCTTYNLYRGVPGDLPKLITPVADSCTRTSTGSLASGHMLSETPAAGGSYWYLVRGQNGFGEGSAGNTSSGPRDQSSTGSCPP